MITTTPARNLAGTGGARGARYWVMGMHKIGGQWAVNKCSLNEVKQMKSKAEGRHGKQEGLNF